MKKILSFVSALFILSCFSVFAQTSLEVSENEALKKDETQTVILITLNSSELYAGAEFALLCGDGITVKSVSYSQNSYTAGPAEARGYIWFSYFSSENTFSGEMKIYITLNCTSEKNTSILLSKVTLYKKLTAGTDSEIITQNKLISIFREGASNPITPPEQPEESTSSVTASGSPNYSSEKEVLQNTSSQSNTSYYDSSKSISSFSSEIFQDNNKTSSDEEKSVTGLLNENNTRETSHVNTFLTVLFVISVLGNILLGYLYIKQKQNIKRRM